MFELTRLFNTLNWDLLQCIQIEASPSGTQTAACSPNGFFPPSTNKIVIVAIYNSATIHVVKNNAYFCVANPRHIY